MLAVANAVGFESCFVRINKMNIALVMGCARSGTSILGELIGSHPDVKYKHEAHAAWNKAGLGENESHRLTAQHATPKVVRQIRKRFELEKGAARLFVEKCPRSVLRVPFIRAVFPEAKLIHIIRDGRDVACSMLPGIGISEWRHLKPPNWQQLFKEERGTMRCAHAWKTIMEIALHDLAGVAHFSVKYEELVENPARLAKDILRFLELPEHPVVFEFCKKIRNATEDSYQAQKQVKWFRDDHQMRVGRWRENLQNGEAQAVEELLRPLLMQLGYER
jgi:hypothetical protein